MHSDSGSGLIIGISLSEGGRISYFGIGWLITSGSWKCFRIVINRMKINHLQQWDKNVVRGIASLLVNSIRFSRVSLRSLVFPRVRDASIVSLIRKLDQDNPQVFPNVRPSSPLTLLLGWHIRYTACSRMTWSPTEEHRMPCRTHWFLSITLFITRFFLEPKMAACGTDAFVWAPWKILI